MKRECGVLLAFWAAGERLEVLAAVTHTEVQAFVCLYNMCAVIEVAEETARLCLWTQTESNHRCTSETETGVPIKTNQSIKDKVSNAHRSESFTDNLFQCKQPCENMRHNTLNLWDSSRSANSQ